MTDITNGAAPADRRGAAAEDRGEDPQSKGFFARIFEAWTPSEEEEDEDDGKPGTTASGLLVPGLLNLRRMRVEDVSIPKAEIVAAPLTSTLDDLVAIFRQHGLTRLPVYDGTLDTPVGLVNLKDFALRHGFDGEHEFDLKAMLRPLLYVPPSMPLGVLLTKMQSERIHMALVIDEYGGTDGLVTIEDLIETVVGEIEDEHDVDEAAPFVREKPGVWMALAKTPVDEFEAATGLNLTAHEEIDEEEVDTLGGLVRRQQLHELLGQLGGLVPGAGIGVGRHRQILDPPHGGQEPAETRTGLGRFESGEAAVPVVVGVDAAWILAHARPRISCRTMVCSRPGPTPMHETCAPASSSRRRT